MANEESDNKLYEIYGLLTDLSDDTEKINIIYEKVEEIGNRKINEDKIYVKKYKDTIRDLKSTINDLHIKIDELNTDLDNRDIELDRQKLQNKLLKDALAPMSVLRISLNTIVNHMWYIYEPIIANLDYNMLSSQLDRPYTIDSNGCKYALARINDKCEGLSKNLCQLYITLNNKYHPKTKPISVVYDSINNIKKLLENKCMPNIFIDSGVDNKIITDFEEAVNNHKFLFKH